MIRGGHLDIAVLGAYQVAENGDLANWRLPGSPTAPAVGGAMDLAAGARNALGHMRAQPAGTGRPRSVRECTLPLTGPKSVNRIYTDLAIIDVTPDGLVVREKIEDLSLDNLQALTGAPLALATAGGPWRRPTCDDRRQRGNFHLDTPDIHHGDHRGHEYLNSNPLRDLCALRGSEIGILDTPHKAGMTQFFLGAHKTVMPVLDTGIHAWRSAVHVDGRVRARPASLFDSATPVMPRPTGPAFSRPKPTFGRRRPASPAGGQLRAGHHRRPNESRFFSTIGVLALWLQDDSNRISPCLPAAIS